MPRIVIDIDENTYQKIKGMENLILKNRTFKSLELAVLEGKVLPERHGRLLILDERLVERNLVSLNATTSFCNKWLSEVGISNSVVKIIPATKEGE